MQFVRRFRVLATHRTEVPDMLTPESFAVGGRRGFDVDADAFVMLSASSRS
jgi:hypothetical protein